MYVYRCIVIFLQVDNNSLLKPQKNFELNWFNVAITTTGELALRWLPTVAWKVREMQIFAFSNCSLGRWVAAYIRISSLVQWMHKSPASFVNSLLFLAEILKIRIFGLFKSDFAGFDDQFGRLHHRWPGNPDPISHRVYIYIYICINYGPHARHRNIWTW